MYYDTNGTFGSTMLVVTGIWAVVGIAFYVWYLWALSKLFPRIGLPASHGWIPVWNQWQLIGRAGLPGWIVLLGFVPGLSIVVLIVSIIAIHRLNTEYGKSVGFTVLGAFIPQIWAMLLATHIDGLGHGSAAAARSRAYAPPGYAPAHPGHAAPGSGYDLPPVPQQPVPAVQSPPSAQAPVGYAPGFAPVPAMPGLSGAQAVPAPPAHHAPAPPAQQTPVQQAPVQQAPVHQAPVSPPAAPIAAPAAAPQRITPVPPAPGTPLPAVQPQPAAPQLAGSQPSWGFSNTTEDAFERLAAQGAGPRAETPLGQAEPQRPFSWPGPEETVARTASASRATRTASASAAPAAAASAPESAAAVPAASAPVPAASAPVPAASAPVSAASAPVPAAAEPSVEQPAEPAQTEPADPQQPQAELAEAPVVAPAPSGFSAPQTKPAAEAQAAQAPAEVVVDDDEEDRTIVVPRRKRWGLELPSGEVQELVGDDVVIGRKPEAPEGGSILKIADPTRTLSKTHVRMRRVGDEWTIEDLQSTNGLSVADSDGAQQVVEAGRELPATERMTIGTLEVVLREIR